MSDPKSEDCSSNLHEYCTPCECECHDYNQNIQLTPEECYYMFKYVLSITWLDRQHYSILKQATDKIFAGIKDYKPTREVEFKE